MTKIKTEYLGLKLRNPLIVSSSGLTSSIERLKRIDASGAGAVVLKSVFEEQILHETSHLESYADTTEAADYLQFYLKEDYIGKYISLITEVKRSLSIPVIASVCCVNGDQWMDFARRIEAAGADAIELNIFSLPTDVNKSSADIESHYLSIVNSVVSAVKLPVSVKIGMRFTNVLGMVGAIAARGAKSVVMFNRFYEPDINIDAQSVVEADIFSTSSELRNSIRWIAITSSRLPKLEIAASGGVHTGEDAVKVLLAGAQVYEVCSEIYAHGLESIQKINDFVGDWMNKNGYTSIDQFRAKLNYASVSNPVSYERAQFMKYFAGRD